MIRTSRSSHPDHVQGNAIFDHAVLISSSDTRQEIAKNGVQLMMEMHNDISTQMESCQQKLLKGGIDQEDRAETIGTIETFQRILNEYPLPGDLRIPELTFYRELEIYGSHRTAHLITFGGAHSACDTVLWLPQVKVVFAGDVIGEPILCLGHPGNWSTVPNGLESLGAEYIIPGHGDIFTATRGFETTKQHLSLMFKIAQQAVATDKPLHFAETVVVPPGQSDYWFRKDIRFLVEHLLNQRMNASPDNR